MNQNEYQGYVNMEIDDVIASYESRLGMRPTLLVIPYDYDRHVPETIEGITIIRTRQKFVVFASHLTDQWVESDITNGNNGGVDKVSLGKPRPRIPEKSVGRPQVRGESKCPLCAQQIQDFNLLGHWWGWGRGFAPPYWEELRRFVFRRDDYTCSNCSSRLPMDELSAHHVIPKERGGPDSARNIVTLCKVCHDYIHDRDKPHKLLDI